MGAAKQIDSKGRLMLGSEFSGTTFLMEKQKDGTLILRPAVIVPVETVWFFKNSKAQNLVKAGLDEAAAGKLKKVNWKLDSKLVADLDDEQ